jgi:hypothetical protein
MRCNACQSVLTQRNARGEPIIRTRGIVFKPGGAILICPRCKGSVPVSLDLFPLLLQPAAEKRMAPGRS